MERALNRISDQDVPLQRATERRRNPLQAARQSMRRESYLALLAEFSQRTDQPMLLCEGQAGLDLPAGDLSVAWLNSAAGALLKVEPSEARDIPLWQVLGDERAALIPVSHARVCTVSLPIVDAVGQVHHLDIKFVPVSPGCWVGQITDPESAQRHALDLAASEARFRILTSRLPIAAGFSDHGLRLGYVNDRMVDLFGQSSEVLLGTGWLSHVVDEQRDDFMDRMALVFTGNSFEQELDINGTEGRRTLSVNVASVPLAGHGTGFVITFEDITERRMLEQKLEHQATHDALTGLPNRAKLWEVLAADVAAERPLALAFVDLDNFKIINDTLGHSVGDHLLQEVASRLKGAASPGDSVHRLSGDEFVVIARDVSGSAAASDFAEKLRRTLFSTANLEGIAVEVSGSVGVVLSRSGIDAETLLRNADVAMYQAKDAGRNGWALYDEAVQQTISTRLKLTQDLRHALLHGRPGHNPLGLHLAYQPIVAMPEGRMEGAEALLRWKHPDVGFISPPDVVDLAVQARLSDALISWLLDEVSHAIRDWDERDPEASPGFISVNATTGQLASVNLTNQVQNLIASGLDPRRLRLEMTETTLANTPKVRATLLALKGLGVKVAIDDFGTGYSSLAYLGSLPVSTLKIDRSFVEPLGTMTDEQADRSLAAAVISIARALSLGLVAEGIEDEVTARQVLRLGCATAQGYFYSRPLPADGILEYARLHSRRT